MSYLDKNTNVFHSANSLKIPILTSHTCSRIENTNIRNAQNLPKVEDIVHHPSTIIVFIPHGFTPGRGSFPDKWIQRTGQSDNSQSKVHNWRIIAHGHMVNVTSLGKMMKDWLKSLLSKNIKLIQKRYPYLTGPPYYTNVWKNPCLCVLHLY